MSQPSLLPPLSLILTCREQPTVLPTGELDYLQHVTAMSKNRHGTGHDPVAHTKQIRNTSRTVLCITSLDYVPLIKLLGFGHINR